MSVEARVGAEREQVEKFAIELLRNVEAGREDPIHVSALSSQVPDSVTESTNRPMRAGLDRRAGPPGSGTNPPTRRGTSGLTGRQSSRGG